MPVLTNLLLAFQSFLLTDTRAVFISGSKNISPVEGFNRAI